MYRQSIRRHRRLLAIPIVLCLGMALWTVAGSPKQYEATASLWVDTPPPAASSLIAQNVALTPPADAQQQVVQELMTTRSFRLEVGHRGPLAAYLAGNPPTGWGPTSLLHRIKSKPSIDDQVFADLSPKKVTTTVSGPQVLQVSFKSTSPVVAAGTLKALVQVLNEQLTKLGQIRNQAALNFYRGQVASASKAVQDARVAVSNYVMQHPGATAASDPQLRALLRARRATNPALARATTHLNAATGALKGPTPSSHVAMVDEPTPPKAALGGKKRLILAVFGGGFLGAVLAFLLLIIVTPSGSQPDEFADPWEEETTVAVHPRAAAAGFTPRAAVPVWHAGVEDGR
jgi:uncharacterized protein involved in exopolysaccharide biosynthesis